MKTKNVASLLMVSSIIWIISDLYWIIQRFSGSSWDYYRGRPVDLILTILMLIVPISLLLFALAFRKNGFTVSQVQEGAQTVNETANNMSVGNWIGTFLLSMIPLVGFILLIVWANDGNNKIRKNWAVAMLIWMVIIFVISIILYATIFAAILSQF